MQIRKTQADDPSSLASELVTARQTYEAVREGVITRAAARVSAVEVVIEEAESEKAALLRIQAEAQQS